VKLSDHFTLSELTKSSTALRKNIPNEPGGIEIDNLRGVCTAILEPIRERFGVPFSPMSGYRSLVLNNEVGSSTQSQHVSGQAVDIEVPGVSNLVLARWIVDNLDFDQLVLEHFIEGDHSSGWVHVSYVGKNRGDVLRFDGSVWSLGLGKKES